MPMGNYSNFADCVRQNQGKVDDPEAYCGSIKKKVEGEEINVTNEVLMNLGALENGLLKDAQLMPIGKWSHPLGTIDITPERAKSFANQFKRTVTGQKLPILYIHSDKGNVANPRYGQAAGWIVDMKADDKQGVLVDIQFTEEGAKAVTNKEYAYLSAEYFDQVQLPHHEAPESDVVVAAALVNRPHLKGMNPLLNSETGHQFLLGQADQPFEGGVMDPVIRQLAETAGIKLSDDQTELKKEEGEALIKFVTDTVSKNKLLETQLSELEDPDEKKARSLEQAGFKEEALLLSEYRADRFVRNLSEYVPKGSQLSPAAEKVAREYALEQTSEKLDALHKILLSETGTVDMTERGVASDKGKEEVDTDLTKKILEESGKIAKEREMSFGEAMDVYAAENPEEWNEYQMQFGAPWARVGGK